MCVIAVRTTTVSRCWKHFHCRSGELICMHQRCDDTVDCRDMSDEHACHDGNCKCRLHRRKKKFQSPFNIEEEGKNIYFANSKNNNNTNIMCKHRGGFPEGQSPIVQDTLSNAEYNIKYLKKEQFTIYYRSTIMNIH